MNETPIEISVVTPAFRAEASIGDTLASLIPLLREETARAEILVVDDGSPDHTADAARKAVEAAGLTADEGPVSFHLLRSDRNRGKGHAVRQGMLQAQGQICIFTDADLAFGTTGFLDLLSALRGGAAAAVASRLVKGASVLVPSHQVGVLLRRHVSSRCLNLLVRILFGIRTRDTQAGLKGFRRPVVDALFPCLRTNRFGADTEIFAVLIRAGLRPVEVPVRFRFGGKSSSVHLLRDGLVTLRELVALRFRLWSRAYSPVIATLKNRRPTEPSPTSPA